LEIKILDERPNPLLKRTEYRFEVDHPTAATPSRAEIRSELAKVVKAPSDRVVIERMNARYGTAKSLGEAALYDSVDAAKAVVREHILIRNGLKEKPVAETPSPPEAPAAPPAAPAVSVETPQEPSKETPKESKKEVSADSSKEHPKEPSKGTHKESAKEPHKDSVKETHKETAKSSSKGT
jgi:small subunit ribosomal protein S24e